MQAIHLGKNISDQRRNFIESQLRPNKVVNQRLLSAFKDVDRANYLPSQYQTLAYTDTNFQIVNKRVSLSPLILARLLNLVEIKSTDHCLIVGGATGYSVAILSSMSENVAMCEEDSVLFEQATSNLKNNQIVNCSLHLGKLTEGFPEKGPYNLVLIEGGVEVIPYHLFDQVDDGGTLITIYNKNYKIGKAGVWQKNNNVVTSSYVFDAFVPCLPGFSEKKVFSL